MQIMFICDLVINAMDNYHFHNDMKSIASPLLALAYCSQIWSLYYARYKCIASQAYNLLTDLSYHSSHYITWWRKVNTNSFNQRSILWNDFQASRPFVQMFNIPICCHTHGACFIYNGIHSHSRYHVNVYPCTYQICKQAKKWSLGELWIYSA